MSLFIALADTNMLSNVGDVAGTLGSKTPSTDPDDT